MLAGANNGLLQAEAAEYMGGLGEADHAAALDEARAFREKHPAGSSGAMAAFDKLSEIGKFAVRILASITGGALRSHTHAQRSDAPTRPALQRGRAHTHADMCIGLEAPRTRAVSAAAVFRAGRVSSVSVQVTPRLPVLPAVSITPT